jgi:hypothetical protein
MHTAADVVCKAGPKQKCEPSSEPMNSGRTDADKRKCIAKIDCPIGDGCSVGWMVCWTQRLMGDERDDGVPSKGVEIGVKRSFMSRVRSVTA